MIEHVKQLFLHHVAKGIDSALNGPLEGTNRTTGFFTTIMHTLDPGEEPTADDMQRMTDIDAELREFGKKLDQEVLGAMLKSRETH